MVNETLSASSDGEKITIPFSDLARQFFNRCFSTPLGEFCFDETGQHRIDLEVTQMSLDTGAMDRVNTKESVKFLKKFTHVMRNDIYVHVYIFYTSINVVATNFTLRILWLWVSQKIFILNKYNQSLMPLEPVRWSTLPGMTWPVLNHPLCGFSGMDGPCEDHSKCVSYDNSKLESFFAKRTFPEQNFKHYPTKKTFPFLDWPKRHFLF